MGNDPISDRRSVWGVLMLLLPLLPLSCLILPFCLLWPSEPEEPPVARAVSPDGLLEVFVRRSVDRGTSYQVFSMSRAGDSKTRELGDVYETWPSRLDG